MKESKKMKKIIALILAGLMILTLAACNNTQTDDEKDTTANDTTENDVVDSGNNDTETDATEPSKAADEILNGTFGKFCEVLSPIFDVPAEDVKDNFVGGYFSEDESTSKMGEAGRTPVDVEDAALTFKSVSLISDDAFAKIDDAAVFHHMMNMNNLAVASMRVANAADVEAVSNAMKESIGNNQWICGFPERYLVITVDNFVISAYGNTDMVNAVKTAVTETYDNAVVVCDEPIA